jgi:RNA polymerase sigma factor (sigma-70 family)
MSLDEATDRQFVLAALRGDGAAWRVIVRRHGALVFATARRAGLSRDDAEDVSQAVFTALLRSLASVREFDRLAPWLVTTTKREAWRVARARRRQRGEPDISEPIANLADVNEALAAADRRDAVARALAAIDERCQELLRALFLSAPESDYNGIADRFGIAVNSVGPIRNRCLRRMLAELESTGFEPEAHGFGRTDGD